MILAPTRIERDKLGWLLCLGCIVGFSGCENYCRSSLLFGKEQVCDPAKELTFLEVGDVQGRWYLSGGDEKKYPSFSFDKNGRFNYWLFGCEPGLWPLVEQGLNSSEGYMGYSWKSLERHEIRRGFFRLEFLVEGHEACLEGQLREDGSLYMKSSRGIMLSGVFVKREPPKEGKGPTSGSEGADDSLTGSGGSSTESNETNAAGSGD